MSNITKKKLQIGVLMITHGDLGNIQYFNPLNIDLYRSQKLRQIETRSIHQIVGLALNFHLEVVSSL